MWVSKGWSRGGQGRQRDCCWNRSRPLASHAAISGIHLAHSTAPDSQPVLRRCILCSQMGGSLGTDVVSSCLWIKMSPLTLTFWPVTDKGNVSGQMFLWTLLLILLCVTLLSILSESFWNILYRFCYLLKGRKLILPESLLLLQCDADSKLNLETKTLVSRTLLNYSLRHYCNLLLASVLTSDDATVLQNSSVPLSSLPSPFNTLQ